MNNNNEQLNTSTETQNSVESNIQPNNNLDTHSNITQTPLTSTEDGDSSFVLDTNVDIPVVDEIEEIISVEEIQTSKLSVNPTETDSNLETIQSQEKPVDNTSQNTDQITENKSNAEEINTDSKATVESSSNIEVIHILEQPIPQYVSQTLENELHQHGVTQLEVVQSDTNPNSTSENNNNRVLNIIPTQAIPKGAPKVSTLIDILPEHYINRELSLLQFNSRVLAQAEDSHIPLLERLRFLCIVSSNMDEFFEVRVASVREQLKLHGNLAGADGRTPRQIYAKISEDAHELINRQYHLWNNVIIPELIKEGITFSRRDHWNEAQREWIKEYFFREVLPVLTPIGLDPAHPFPKVFNKSLNFVVELEGKDAFGRNAVRAIVQAPRALPRVIRLPEELATSKDCFVFLSSIMHAHVDELFKGMKLKGCFQFRVTRNSDLFVDEEIENLRIALQGELPQRNFGDAVRLEVADTCPKETTDFLLGEFGLEEHDLYRVNGPVNLARLMAVPDKVDRPDLEFDPFMPGIPSFLDQAKNPNFFKMIKERDLLLHHPYESFQPVVDFLQQAANDPNVLAIKQTVYRTGIDSMLVEALIQAARNGKEVTAVVELLARFDEQANIKLAERLEEVGAHVVYGVVGHKVHAKMLMVVRREEDGIRRYVHLGTGNYHPRTAKIYCDFGMFTCDKAIGDDVANIFNQITGMGKASKLNKLLQSPFTLHAGLLEKIDREIENAKEGLPARIVAKMNSLVEPKMIAKLYQASQAGVRIDLIVRGVCALRPGVQGISENITVRSIIGRFLEHHRIFYFRNAKEIKGRNFGEVYLASADWMDRNFFRRVETCFPVEKKKLKRRVIKEGLLGYLHDNAQAWIMQSDGSYEKAVPKPNRLETRIQLKLLNELGKTSQLL